ncbi:MAG: hypothetical protein JWM45_477 [Pseudonocardiales bacterium]|jgi:hypothetical protein|nr:hypothetical protein [Pseudonocardiales bacterium]
MSVMGAFAEFEPGTTAMPIYSVNGSTAPILRRFQTMWCKVPSTTVIACPVRSTRSPRTVV